MSRSHGAVDVSEVLSAMVGGDLDVTDLLAHLVADCAEETGAAAVALLARLGVQQQPDELALLAATSHRASEIEMLQAQRRAGPSFEAVVGGRVVVATGDELVTRWGDAGRAIRDAGFEAVEAYPMCWRAQSLGVLNLFRNEARGPDALLRGQVYADIAALVVVQLAVLSPELGRSGLGIALEARAVVEQAKGVLAYLEDLDMEEAYAELLGLAERADASLTEVARDVVRRRGRV